MDGGGDGWLIEGGVEFDEKKDENIYGGYEFYW